MKYFWNILVSICYLGVALGASEPMLLDTKSHQVVSPTTIDFSSATVLGLPPSPPAPLTLTGDVTGTGTATVSTVIGNSKVTLAKIQNATANSKLLGSGATGSGAPYSELTLGTNLSMSGTTLNATGGAPVSATYITETPDATLTNEFALGSLATGLLKNTTTTGVPTIAVAGTDYEAALGNPGTSGFVLSSTTGGARSWIAPGGTPGGSNTQVQYNNSGVFGGDAGLTWNNSTFVETITGNQNAQTLLTVLNTNGSGAATASVNFQNGSNAGQFGITGTGYTPNGVFLPDEAYMYASAANGIAIGSASPGPNSTIKFAAGGPTSQRMVISPSAIWQPSDSLLGWGSSTTPAIPPVIDTALYRNAPGIVEVNNGTAGQFGQLQASGVTVSPVAGKTGNAVSSQRIVTSTLDQTAIAETAHVVYTVPANVCVVGTTFRITAWGDMDAGTTSITFIPKIRWGGTGGVQLLATPTVASTTTALTGKTWQAVALVTIRTIGATGTAMAEMELSNHISQTTGVFVQDEANSGSTAVTIDTTANKDLDLTWTLSATTGTPHVRTYGGIIEMVRN